MMRTLAILVLFLSLIFTGQVIQAQDIPNIIVGATWSPDGEFVSYQASDGIHVMDKAGNNNRLLAAPTGFGGWTADSNGVFLIENNSAQARFEWWIYPVNGDEPVQFLPHLHSISTLAYAHDGEYIAISAQQHESDPFQVWVANADGSQLKPLTEYQAYHLDWSRDDTQIVFETFVDGQTLEVAIDISGENEPQISPLTDGIRSIGNSLDLHFAPDMSYLPATLYITDIMDNQESVFTVNQWVVDMDYSEASQSIVYIAYCNPTDVDAAFLQGEWSAAEQETIETALYRIDLKTGEQTMLVACGNGSQRTVSWSPDGQEILFIWVNNHDWDVYRITADAGRFVNLTEE